MVLVNKNHDARIEMITLHILTDHITHHDYPHNQDPVIVQIHCLLLAHITRIVHVKNSNIALALYLAHTRVLNTAHPLHDHLFSQANKPHHIQATHVGQDMERREEERKK
jgi:CDP-glycerol glycerophosphotransferase (TagB/SpsB family)